MPPKGHARGKGAVWIMTNTVEGMFGVFKRGMTGVYQHCGDQRISNAISTNSPSVATTAQSCFGVEDTQRACIAIRGAEGKRLTCWRPASD